ncbi:MAG: 50S ribosomal protein L18 [Candidatus Saliniplasma sp.]
MAEGPTHRMPLKRRREGKTDYRQRLRLLKSGKTRAVVRITNKNVIVQFTDYHEDGDIVKVNVDSNHIRGYGWEGHGSNLPSSYLVGFLAGKKALDIGIQEAVLDIGLNIPEKGGRIFSVLNGIVDAGVDVPHDPEILPSSERKEGKHINEETVENFYEVKEKLEAL